MHKINEYLRDDIHDITISLIGAGGSGSFMLSNLCRINHALKMMGRKGLYVLLHDHDTVSEFNVGRQLFTPSDIGKFKAKVLIDRVNRTFGTEWDYATSPIKKNNIPLNGNIIITCVDNLKARRAVKYRFDLDKKQGNDVNDNHYWLDMGNGKNFGQVILSDGKDLPNIFDMFPNLRESKADGQSCSMMESLNRQDLFINSTLTQYAGKLLFDLLTKENLNYHGMFINLETIQTKAIPCPKKQ